MIRPLVLLIVDIKPHDPSIRILTSHHPALDASENTTMLDPMGIKPIGPLPQILPLAHPPRDGIPTLLRGRLLRHIAEFNDQFGGTMLAHFGKQFVVRRKVVVLWQWSEWEDIGIEVVCLFDGKTGQFQMVDAVERGRHGWLRRRVGHAFCKAG